MTPGGADLGRCRLLSMFPSAAGAPDLHGPLRSFVDAELDRLLRKVAGIRATASPLLMLLAGVVVWADPAPWRRAVVGTAAMIAMVGALWSARQVRLHGISRHGLAANLVAMAVFQVVMVAATGGLESPLLPVLLPLSIAAGLLIGRQRALLPVLATPAWGARAAPDWTAVGHARRTQAGPARHQ